MKKRSLDKQLAESTARWIKNETPPGRASDCIHTYDELKPGDKVVVVTCVSGRDRRPNLDDQLANLRQHVESRGAIVVGTHRLIGQRYRPLWIKKAVAKLKRKRADWLLAETTDRFARNPDFDCMHNSDVQATPKLLRTLQRLSGNRLMTHLNPDATASEIRSYQRKRGQRHKGNKGGRPKKITYRPRYNELPKTVARVRWLRAKGKSWRFIAQRVCRSPSTIRGWCSRAGQK
jgi:hypothetical protein